MCVVRGHLFLRNKEMRLYKKANKSVVGNLRVRGGLPDLLAPQSICLEQITFSVHVQRFYGLKLFGFLSNGCLFVCFFSPLSFDLTPLHLTFCKVTTVNMSQKTAQESDQIKLKVLCFRAFNVKGNSFGIWHAYFVKYSVRCNKIKQTGQKRPLIADMQCVIVPLYRCRFHQGWCFVDLRRGCRCKAGLVCL